MSGARRLPGPVAQPRVAALLDALGIVPVRVTALAPTDPWRRSPRSYLVEDRRGGRFKVRFGRAADRPEHVALLARALGDERVPPPLAVDRGVTVWEWVEGRTLDRSPSEPHVERAGELLAWLHSRPSGAKGRQRSTAALVVRAARQLEELTGAGVVTPGMRAGLGALLSLLPASAAWGVVHGDFCGENLVAAHDGTVVSIDHERMRSGFVGYDVARTWSRWVLPGPLERRFLGAYEGVRPLPSERALRGWRAAAVIKRLHLRHRHGVPSSVARERAEQLVALT